MKKIDKTHCFNSKEYLKKSYKKISVTKYKQQKKQKIKPKIAKQTKQTN